MSESLWLQDLSNATRPQTNRELAAQGIGEGALRGRRWRRIARGIYAPAVDGQLTSAQRILDASGLLAGGPANGGWATSGWAAAYVLGVDWLDGQDAHTGRQLPIDLVAPRRRRANTEMIKYRHCPLPEDDVIMSGEIALTSLERTAFDGVRWAGSLEEAVVFLDSVLAFEGVSANLLIGGFRSYIAQQAG